MLAWAAATLVGIALALVAYRGREIGAARVVPLVALRAAALALVIALLAGAPAGRAPAARPLVALDVSASWRRGGDSTAWHTARARARTLVSAMRADTLWLFGDSLRPGDPPALPADPATRAAPAAERARAAGRPLVLITDGEVDDAPALGALPPGSRVELVERAPHLDAAVVDVQAPATVVAGDSFDVRATLRSGERAVSGAQITLLLDGRRVATRSVDTLPPRSERVIALRAVAASAAGSAVLTIALAAPGDAEPRNDTASVALDVARAAGAVFLSTAPDEDIRYLVPVLRGALSLPARGFYRVAPGRWRREGTLDPATDADVRSALRATPLAIIHGDTALLGPPRRVSGGALLLLPTGDAEAGEWFATSAPASPVAGPLAGALWDSLPPLAVSTRQPEGEWRALIVARARRFDARAAIAGSERGRRTVVVGASGFWRWSFRGGASADVYATLWGGILDWLAAERRDLRAAVPEHGVLRAGEPVRWWRGGGKSDSLVTIELRHRGAAGVDTVRLHFALGAPTAESAPLAQGVYNARAAGGVSVLVVNASTEWLPRAPSVRAFVVAAARASGGRPPLRDRGWAYALVIAALCTEWMLRRRAGLR